MTTLVWFNKKQNGFKMINIQSTTGNIICSYCTTKLMCTYSAVVSDTGIN